VAKWRAVRRQMLLIARCMGRIPAWVSRATFEVDHIAPVMNTVEVHWMRASFVVKAMDPHFFFLPGAGLWMGLHHTSAV
jgi:hypothetical protein